MEVTAKNATFQKYPIYKDTGVEWLEEIPEKWEVLPSKRFHQVKKKSNSKRECDNVLSLTLRGVVNNDPDSPEGMVPKDYGTYQIFDKNNLVFKLIDLENVKTSRVGIVHEKGIMSSAYIRLIVGDENFARYTYYYFYSLYINEVYNKLGSGVRSTLGPSDLLNIPYIKPPLQEQITIAHFLDDKTTKIDRVIAQKQQMIALLKERKQIIIQNAVTKGLDPNAKMKDSGAVWIGEIPESWSFISLKYILKERNERSEEGKEPILMMSQVHGLVIRSDFHDKAEVAQTTVGSKIVYTNDLVFNKLKAHLGVFFKSTIPFNGIVSPDYAVYYGNGMFKDMKYLELLFRHPAYISQFICKATGIVEGLIRLYTSELFSIKVPVPPINEQENILAYIETQSAKIDKAIKLQEQQIEKIKELKATLIDGAVTGKIKIF